MASTLRLTLKSKVIWFCYDIKKEVLFNWVEVSITFEFEVFKYYVERFLIKNYQWFEVFKCLLFMKILDLL